MIYLNSIHNPYTLNIFCDASIKTIKNMNYGCYGAVAIYEDNIIDSSYQICSRTTNNDSEIRAIRSAVLLALKYRNNYQIINIFSDSQISLFGIRDRCFRWKEKDSKLYGYSLKDPIKNQSVFIEIIKIITDNNLYINFYHQKGHVKNNIRSYNEATHVFLSSNQIRDNIDIEFIKYISYYNNMVDNESRKMLGEMDIHKLPYIQPISFVPVDYYIMLDTYNNIIKRR